MTPDEIRALAERIATLLAKREWVPGPVRPDPPAGPTQAALPPWAGAAQGLTDVAPLRGPTSAPGRHRPAYGELSAAARAAAAGRGPAPLPGGADPGLATPPAPGGRTVPVARSNRHVHLSQPDVDALFGPGHGLTPDFPIKQPGQFAAQERVRVVGPEGAIDDVRVVGPARGATQVELAVSDCRTIGLDAPLRHSGDTADSSPVRLEGPAGSRDLERGAIVPARHLHMNPQDAARLGLAGGDRASLVVGSGDRRVTLHEVLVRAGERHETELHLDSDESRAVGLARGTVAVVVGRTAKGSRDRTERGRRQLVTERDVDRLAARGLKLADRGSYLMTPAARDRAKALGIWDDGA